ncbi:MAG TPA: hypothetical protein VK134_03575 [Ktedonobacteraceae bacterium]|nr:hypothetical protein [Ktedonobacteraceae bacterium]
MSTNYVPRRRVTRRGALYSMVLLALLAWGALLAFTHFEPPNSIVNFVVVFILLFVALAGTLSPLAYVISLRFISSRLYRATLRHSLRQGMLVALWIVFNLILRALHSWSLFTAIVSLGIIAVIELLSLARK